MSLGWSPVFEKQHSRFVILAQAMLFERQEQAVEAGRLFAAGAEQLLGLRFTGEALLLVDGAIQYAEAEIPIPVALLSGPGVDASFRFGAS